MSGGNSNPPDMKTEMVAALEALFLADERWRQTLSPGTTLIQRSWDNGTVDTLVLLSSATAYAVRETADGKRPWSVTGSATLVVDAVRQVVPPDDPNAPKAPDAGLPMGEWR
ncbi:MAG: hypothetical protein GEV28_28065 [Actinophytocola sp.]|uniref:hypothetical protein n=1 Tax=Actinophytocola sp. TaxID=1872138 RepID=UPI0013297C33|nr:hypothetical protein [Actinophytocola sp.]MPZ84041.1 hypothetical protein [Actinophytocola sp.]